MTFDNYKFTIRLPSGGINSSDKTDNEWDQYIVNSTLNGAISTPGDNTVWNWQNIYSWTSTVNTYASNRRTVRGYTTSSNSSWATTDWVTNICGFRPVLLIESLYTPTVKYLFEDNGEVKKYGNLSKYSIDFTGSGSGAVVSTPTNELKILGDMTVQFKVKARSLSGNPRLIAFGENGETENTNVLYAVVANSDGTIEFQHEYGTGNDQFFKTVNPYLSVNTWYDIAVTRNTVNKTFRFYINGEFKEEIIYKNNPTGGLNGKLWFGSWLGNLYHFNGMLDDIKIWNKILTDAEIKKYAKELPAGNEPGLVGYWKVEEGDGTILTDLTPFSNHASVTNGTLSEDIDVTSNMGWKTLGPAPATEEMFLNDGMNDLSIIDDHALQQLESDTPKLLMYIDDPNKTSAFVNLTAVPHGQLIFQEGDIDVSAGVESLSVNAIVQNLSTLKIIASPDQGVTWKTFNGATWQTITPDAVSVKENGMTPDVVNGLIKEQINDLLQGSNTLRFAYYLEQDQVTDVVNVDDITITASPVATETPTLDSIKIVYDELTIEGRMQDLERINAINMAKLQFKSNALLQSDKYKLHDLVVDTFETTSGVDLANTNAVYDAINKEFVYDTSDGAPPVQEVVLQEEELPVYRKKFMLYADHDGNIDYEYSLDGGVTWNPITLFTIVNLTGQTETKLKIKARLKDSTAKLRGIAFSWA